MPLLAAFFGTIFGTLVTWLGTFLTKRVANYVANVAVIAAAAAALWAACQAAIGAIGQAMPSQLVIAAGWFIPGNVDECVAAYFACEIAMAGYRFHKETLRASAGLA